MALFILTFVQHLKSFSFWIIYDNMALRFLTYNVKGLNSVQKRWMTLKEFKSLAADVIMIQETHFRPGGSFKFASKLLPTSYMASDPSGKAGVAILICSSCPLQIKSLYLDPHGRFVFLDCDYLTHSLTLVSVYAANTNTKTNKKFSQPNVIIGGDFNVTMSPGKDRRVLFPTISAVKVIHLSTSFRRLLRTHSLLDIWRIKHPTHRQYTFYSPPTNCTPDWTISL